LASSELSIRWKEIVAEFSFTFLLSLNVDSAFKNASLANADFDAEPEIRTLEIVFVAFFSMSLSSPSVVTEPLVVVLDETCREIEESLSVNPEAFDFSRFWTPEHEVRSRASMTTRIVIDLEVWFLTSTILTRVKLLRGDLRYNSNMFRRPVVKDKKTPVTYGSEKTIQNLRTKLNAVACESASERVKARFVGEVKSMRIVPRGNSHWYEMVIADGTGIVNGWFFGRRSIPGIGAGSLVLFEGLVQLDEGEMTIANPYYEIL